MGFFWPLCISGRLPQRKMFPVFPRKLCGISVVLMGCLCQQILCVVIWDRLEFICDFINPSRQQDFWLRFSQGVKISKAGEIPGSWSSGNLVTVAVLPACLLGKKSFWNWWDKLLRIHKIGLDCLYHWLDRELSSFMQEIVWMNVPWNLQALYGKSAEKHWEGQLASTNS